MIDVSNNNGHVNWQLVYRAGHRIAAIKASEGSESFHGTYYDDAYFRYNMLAAKENGILPLPYYYGSPTWSGKTQARHFLEICHSHIGRGNGRLILDIEETYGVSNEELQTWCKEFCETLESVTHDNTIVYTYTAFTSNLGSSLIKCPLWIANYDFQAKLPPDAIGAWPKKKVFGHQFSDKGHCEGIEGNVDLSHRFVSLYRFKMGRFH